MSHSVFAILKNTVVPFQITQVKLLSHSLKLLLLLSEDMYDPILQTTKIVQEIPERLNIALIIAKSEHLDIDQSIQFISNLRLRLSHQLNVTTVPQTEQKDDKVVKETKVFHFVCPIDNLYLEDENVPITSYTSYHDLIETISICLQNMEKTLVDAQTDNTFYTVYEQQKQVLIKLCNIFRVLSIIYTFFLHHVLVETKNHHSYEGFDIYRKYQNVQEALNELDPSSLMDIQELTKSNIQLIDSQI